MEDFQSIKSIMASADLDRRSRSIFDYLADSPNQVIKKSDILDHVWSGQIVHENSLHQGITRLRRALRDDGTILETIYGIGYRLNCHIENGEGTTANAPLSMGRNRTQWAYAALACLMVLIVSTAMVPATSALSLTNIMGDKPKDGNDAVLRLLADDILLKADPYSGDAFDPSVLSLAQRVAGQIDTRFANQPEVQLKLHQRIGDIKWGWGDYANAAIHMRRAATLEVSLHGEGRPDYADILTKLCEMERMSGELVAAEEHCSRAIALTKKADYPNYAAPRIAQGKLEFEFGRYIQARKVLAEFLPDDRQAKLPHDLRAESLWFNALSARKLGEYRQSEALFQKLLALRESHWGQDHPLTAWAMADYGDLLLDLQRYEDSRAYLTKAIRIFETRMGADNPETCSPIYSMAVLNIAERKWHEAIDKLEKCLKVDVASLGPDHFWTLYTQSHLAVAYAGKGDRAKAKSLLEAAQLKAGAAIAGKAEKAAHFEIIWAEGYALLGDRVMASRLALSAQKRIAAANFPKNHTWFRRIDMILREP